MTLKAASARCDITPPVGIAHANWGAASHEQAEGVDLPLWGTALVLQTGDEAPIAIIDLDLLQIPTAQCNRIREKVESVTGIPFDHIRVSWTHTHSGPTLTTTWVNAGAELIEPYVNSLPDRIAGIVWEAANAVRPVLLRAMTGRCPVNVNRRLTLPDGGVVVGQNPDGFVDPEVLVLRLDPVDPVDSVDPGDPVGPGDPADRADAAYRGDDKPIIVVGYACHPTIMAHRNRLITPDYPGVVKRVVESAVGGTCLFLQGAAGNQASIEDLTSDRASYRRIGANVGHEAARLAWACATPPTPMTFDQVVESGATLALFRAADTPEQATSLQMDNDTVSLPVRALPPIGELEQTFAEHKADLASLRQMGADDEAIRSATYRAKRASHTLNLGRVTRGQSELDLPVQVLRIGECALVSLPVEPFAEFGKAIKDNSPFPITFVSGYSNGVYGYMPTRRAYDEGGYEIGVSPFTGGAEERLVAGVTGLLKRMV